jgi:hypothetical protein
METVLIVLVVLFLLGGGGILSLARLTRSQDERVTMLFDPNRAACMRGFDSGRPRTLFQVP